MSDFLKSIFESNNKQLTEHQRAQVVFEIANTILFPIKCGTEQLEFYRHLPLLNLIDGELVSIAQLFKQYKGCVIGEHKFYSDEKGVHEQYKSDSIAVINPDFSNDLFSLFRIDHVDSNDKDLGKVLQNILLRFVGVLSGQYLSLLHADENGDQILKDIAVLVRQWVVDEKTNMYVCDSKTSVSQLVDEIILECEILNIHYEIFGPDKDGLYKLIELFFSNKSLTMFNMGTLNIKKFGISSLLDFKMLTKNTDPLMIDYGSKSSVDWREQVRESLEFKPKPSLLLDDYKLRMSEVVNRLLEMEYGH